MRLRHKPWAQDTIRSHPQIILADPMSHRGSWEKVFNNTNPTFIEIGTGKGQFLTGLAKKYPDINFVGIERFQSVIISALDKIVEDKLENMKLLNMDANLLTDVFGEGEISRIYLNFSDPWPKKRHAKRRLTYLTFLEKYETILKQDGEIHMKTDNQGLFEYSLESFSAYGMVLKNISLDLHHSDMTDNIMTEYEEKFSEKGNRIYRCEASFRN